MRDSALGRALSTAAADVDMGGMITNDQTKDRFAPGAFSARCYPFYTDTHTHERFSRFASEISLFLSLSRTISISPSRRIRPLNSKAVLTLACDDFQPLGAYLPSLFSGSMNKYSPSAREMTTNALLLDYLCCFLVGDTRPRGDGPDARAKSACVEKL